jgi:pimeloyl-ACP methyl ester carboxylesterase
VPARPPLRRSSVGGTSVRHSWLIGGAIGALALSGCTITVGNGHGTAVLSDSGSAPSTSTPGTPSQSSIDWGSCSSILNLGAVQFPSDRTDDLSVGCATVTVPADYSQPSGSTMSIQLVRVHDKNNTSGRSLLINPGGPGASGVDFGVGLSTELPLQILDHYDVIGFDPRGVGLSSPVNCISDAQKDINNAASPNVLTASGFAAAKASAAAVAAACSNKYGETLADYTTQNTARDMDRIRQGLGEQSLDYLGFSYGTELGAAYAHLFPSHVGRMVLDGAVDPYTDSITSFADQLKGFELAFDQFAAYCQKTAPCSQLGDPRQAVYAIVAAANAQPLHASGDSRHVTSSLALTGVLQALYSRSQWPTLGQALIAGRSGDGQKLLDLADEYNERQSDGSYTNIQDANTAIGCNDQKVGPDDTTIHSTAVKWQQADPMFGLWSAPGLFSCQQWQSTRDVVPVPTATDAANKILVIGNLHDPATPYQGAKDLTRALGDAELLTWNGEGHTSYLEGSSCVDNDVNAYLISGTFPPDGTVCQ